MKRRALLATLPFALAGCLSGYPGPTGPRNPPIEPEDNPRDAPPQKPLVAGGFEFEEADNGSLRVVLTVTNRTDNEASGTVTGTLSLNGETYEQSSSVTVGGDSESAVELLYEEVTFEAYEDANSVNFSASVE